MAANCGIALLEVNSFMLTAPDFFVIWKPELILIVQEKFNFMDSNSVDEKLHLKLDVFLGILRRKYPIGCLLNAYTVRLLFILTAYAFPASVFPKGVYWTQGSVNGSLCLPDGKKTFTDFTLLLFITSSPANFSYSILPTKIES